MAYTLQQLSDLEDIRTLKHRYFRAVDTADAQLLSTLFTEDISVDFRGGHYRVKLEGRNNMLEFLANSINAGALAMHHGHMPEITLTGENEAKGIWYLEDIFINVDHRSQTWGTALYRDAYRRENGRWLIAATEYDRICELTSPLREDVEVTSHYLARAGRKPHELTDISHLISWTQD